MLPPASDCPTLTTHVRPLNATCVVLPSTAQLVVGLECACFISTARACASHTCGLATASSRGLLRLRFAPFLGFLVHCCFESALAFSDLWVKFCSNPLSFLALMDLCAHEFRSAGP
ncbi:unnamed protein product [Camellia sinensis]